MVREILFRAKRMSCLGWYEGYLLKDKVGCYIITPAADIFRSDFEVFCVQEDTVCQYTGIDDKNGAKIFENDILLLSEVRYRVEWKDDAAQFVINKDGAQFPFDSYWECEVEVIGNIFDNQTVEDGEI